MDKKKQTKPTFQVKPLPWGFHSKEGGRHANEDRAVAITKERLWLSLEKARLKANKVKEKESRKAKKLAKTEATATAPPASEAKPAPRVMARPEKKRSQVFEGAQFNERELESVASQVQFGASFFAVYDGHGGKKTVNFVKKHLHKNIINQETRQLFFVSNDQDVDELGYSTLFLPISSCELPLIFMYLLGL